MPKHYHRKKKSLAMKAYKLAKSLQRGQETKHRSTANVQTNIDWDGTGPIIINEPAQGTGDTDRIGDSIFCTSIRWRFIADNEDSAASAVRVICFWDKKNTVTNVTDLLRVTGSPNALTSDYNVDKRGDYIILYDKMINVDGVIALQKVGFVRLKIKKLTQFADGGFTIEKGALKFIFISDVNSGAAAKPSYRANYRVYYTDS